ncbi:sensor histidine kinase [Actinomadura hibisca]|uniref:sensor histidine kinase n=1 Tax=Actinomadura hibisca TaxID=68565 RepID=UPI00082F3F2A|nr:nitrate- and nitrite sensing domain-containing protein [Actinomadura hibisca]
MSPRLSSIRARITLLVLVPLLSLAGLWAFVTVTSYGDAAQLLNSREFQQKSVLPTQRLIGELQKERRLSVWRLGADPSADRGVLNAQRQSTDEARAAVERGSRDAGLRGAVLPHVRARIEALVARLNALESVRRTVDDHTAERQRALAEYSGMIDAGFAIYSSVTPGDGAIASDARTLTAMGRAREFLSRQDALLSGALAAGRMTAAERGQFAQLSGAQRFLFADTSPNLPAGAQNRYRTLVDSAEFERLRRLEDQVVRGTDTVRNVRQPGRNGTHAVTTRVPVTPVDAAIWRATADTANHRLYEFENALLAEVTDRAENIAIGVFTRLAIAGGLGLLAVVASALIATGVSRRLLRECRTLAARVTDFARHRLPVLADQVRAGEPVDAAAEPVDVYRINEIREISESFTATRDAVLVAAAGEIAARRGVSEVFVNLARRNQALLHRQLSLLDTMERRTEDPAELADLFRLDHLATRMRRHAEGLVILAGKSTGRGWRRPVPLVDVVRGAVAEVEDYPRVRVQPLPRIALVGTAVADVMHLLAEMVENATTFSPPQSPVQVSGHAVGNGFAIEIEDRGLGMTEEAVRVANARLADPPEFDPSDSARLGLFVVARLARRHDIKVTLRQSPYGGTTAIALLPGDLITEHPDGDLALRRSTGPMPALAQSGNAAAQPGVVRLVAEPAATQAAVPAATPGNEAPATDPEPFGAKPTGPEPSVPQPTLTVDGLPRRRRQENLAPQLRDQAGRESQGRHAAVPETPAPEPQAAPVPAPAPAEPGGERSPESLRTMMSAMQQGWQRGRHQAQQAQDLPDQEPHRAEEDDTP